MNSPGSKRAGAGFLCANGQPLGGRGSGPQGPEAPGLYLPIPEGAELIDLWINSDGTCYVSFSAPFLEGEPAPTSQARLLLYAIVNTLCQLSDVSAVRLLVEGESPEEYGGVPTTSPLEPNQNLVVP